MCVWFYVPTYSVNTMQYKLATNLAFVTSWRNTLLNDELFTIGSASDVSAYYKQKISLSQRPLHILLNVEHVVCIIILFFYIIDDTRVITGFDFSHSHLSDIRSSYRSPLDDKRCSVSLHGDNCRRILSSKRRSRWRIHVPLECSVICKRIALCRRFNSRWRTINISRGRARPFWRKIDGDIRCL